MHTKTIWNMFKTLFWTKNRYRKYLHAHSKQCSLPKAGNTGNHSCTLQTRWTLSIHRMAYHCRHVHFSYRSHRHFRFRFHRHWCIFAWQQCAALRCTVLDHHPRHLHSNRKSHTCTAAYIQSKQGLDEWLELQCNIRSLLPFWWTMPESGFKFPFTAQSLPAKFTVYSRFAIIVYINRANTANIQVHVGIHQNLMASAFSWYYKKTRSKCEPLAFISVSSVKEQSLLDNSSANSNSLSKTLSCNGFRAVKPRLKVSSNAFIISNLSSQKEYQ